MGRLWRQQGDRFGVGGGGGGQIGGSGATVEMALTARYSRRLWGENNRIWLSGISQVCPRRRGGKNLIIRLLQLPLPSPLFHPPPQLVKAANPPLVCETAGCRQRLYRKRQAGRTPRVKGERRVDKRLFKDASGPGGKSPGLNLFLVQARWIPPPPRR